jgi:hypothetical protein
MLTAAALRVVHQSQNWELNNKLKLIDGHWVVASLFSPRNQRETTTTTNTTSVIKSSSHYHLSSSHPSSGTATTNSSTSTTTAHTTAPAPAHRHRNSASAGNAVWHNTKILISQQIESEVYL